MLCNVYSVLRNIVTLFTEKYRLSAFTDRFFAHFFCISFDTIIVTTT